MKGGIVLGIFLLIISSVLGAVDIRNNVLVNGTKYQYESYVEMKDGKYIPLFGMGLMMVPQGEVPPGLLGSVAAVWSSGYQAKAKLAETGPQEELIAKHVSKSVGGSSGIKSQIIDPKDLKPPLDQQ